MPDMALTVAVAILRGGEFAPDKDEMRWALPSARAALEACHHDELVETLSDVLKAFLSPHDGDLTHPELCEKAAALLAKVGSDDA